MQWLQSSEVDQVWLQLLVEDRDAGVKCAGLSLLCLLCGKPGVLDLLLTGWTPLHPLSVWGVCVKLALENREASLVRKQVHT